MENASQRYGYAAGGTRPFELSDTSMTEGAFFELDTPVASNHDGRSSSSSDDEQAFSEVDVDSDMRSVHSRSSSSQRRSLERLEAGDSAMKPWPEIVLRWKRFLLALSASIVLVVGLTIWFWTGILVRTIKEPVGDSTESEKLLRRYNTYSGVTMGIFEAFLGLGFAHFFPAFTVYVHNLKWWPGDDPTVRANKTKKVLLLLFFPVVMVAVGNSFSALQAGTSTIRLDVDMNATSLMNNVSAFDTANLSTMFDDGWVGYHEDSILKTAVLRQATPFTFVLSKCSQAIVARNDTTRSGLKRMTDIDSTSAVFGFPLKEWSREVYPMADATFSNASLPLDTSFELLFQGQAFLERWVASLPSYRCRYISANGTKLCGRRKRSTMLDTLYGYANGTKTKTPEALKKEIVAGMQNAFFGDLDETVDLTLTSFSLRVSPQIEVQMMSYAMMLAPDFEFGLPNDTTVVPPGCKGAKCEYRYKMLDVDTFCGERTCVLPDWQSYTIPRKQAAMMQYKRKCQASRATVDPNLKTHMPGGCEDVPNAVFFAGFGSRMFLDTFAMDVNTTTGKPTATPYAKNPRRAITLTVGKLVWTHKALTTPFRATCGVGDGSDDACAGLVHALQPSGRYVLLGKDFVPKAIATSDFRQPITLFQLLQPAILSPRAEHAVVVPEYLDAFSLRSRTGSLNVTVAATKCSALMDAYMVHVAANNYYLYSTYQPMYMSALLYLFQNAAVTKVRSTGADVAEPRLAGDRAVHKILIKNTTVGVYTVWTGCVILIVLACVVLLFPNERARLTPMAGKNARAERFVAVQTEEVYPNLVYMKRFRIGKTGEALKLSEFAVESVRLHHKMEDDEQVVL